MKEVADKKFNPYRRVLLRGGLAASTAGVLQACGGGGSNGTGATGDTAQMAQTSTQCPSQLLAKTSTGSATPLQPIPSYSVSLDSYGGVTGASASTLINDFKAPLNCWRRHRQSVRRRCSRFLRTACHSIAKAWCRGRRPRR